MFARVALWIAGVALITCWFGVLFDKQSHGRIRIDIDDNSVFLGLSILLAGWVVAIGLPSRSTAGRLASDYVNFIAKIGDKNLTLDQLAEEAGEATKQSLDDSGSLKWESYLSPQQQRSLERLIYEGKIRIRDGQYSLPNHE